jgi:hypothetical protein
VKASQCCAALVVGISKCQHPGRHSFQELGKALGNLKLSDTWLTNSLLQQSPDSGKVAIIPVDCKTETRVSAIFTAVAFLGVQKIWQLLTTISWSTHISCL